MGIALMDKVMVLRISGSKFASSVLLGDDTVFVSFCTFAINHVSMQQKGLSPSIETFKKVFYF